MSETYVADDDITIVRTDIPTEEPTPQLPATVQRQARAEYRAAEHPDGEFFDSSTMEYMLRLATLMAKASLIPESLWAVKDASGNKVPLPFQTVVANCFLIVNQARMWKVDAFALAQSASVVHGKVVYEGKVIAAVLESTRGIRLRYVWSGTIGADSYAVKAYERDLRDGEEGRREIEGTVAAWATKKKGGARSDNWVGHASKQQLAYRAAREWARLHEPGLVLGVLAGDDAEAVAGRIEQDRTDGADPLAFGSGFRAAPDAKAAALKARQRARRPRFPQAESGEVIQDEPKTPDETAPAASGQAEATPAATDGQAGDASAAGGAPVTSSEEPDDPFVVFLSRHLPASGSWADIKAAFQALQGTPEWDSHVRGSGDRGGDSAVLQVMCSAWHRVRALMAEKKGPIDVDFNSDAMAFRCWLEAQTSSTSIHMTFEGFREGQAWKNMTAKIQAAIRKLVALRIAECDRAEMEG